MDWKVMRINQEIKKHDKCLMAHRCGSQIQIWRQAPRLEASDLSYEETNQSRPMVFICALTHDWTATGNPVDRGIEPVMAYLKEADSWSKDSIVDKLRQQRERAQRAKEQSMKNDVRARAADLRKDFAHATNEINTSTLEKVDNRRLKYGSS